MNIDENKISITQADPLLDYYNTCQIEKEHFDIYEINQPFNFSVTLKNFSKILDRLKKSKNARELYFEFNYNFKKPNFLKISLIGSNQKRNFSLEIKEIYDFSLHSLLKLP